MTAVLFRHRTAELEAWLADRHARGADRCDEVWEGVYVVNPMPRVGHQEMVETLIVVLRPLGAPHGLKVIGGCNVGYKDDYRCPDVTVFDAATDPETVYVSSVAVAVEVRSPEEDPEAKLPFYLERGVREVVLVDRGDRSLRWLASTGGAWVDVDRSDVLDTSVSDIVAGLRWP